MRRIEGAIVRALNVELSLPPRRASWRQLPRASRTSSARRPSINCSSDDLHLGQERDAVGEHVRDVIVQSVKARHRFEQRIVVGVF